MKNVLLGLCLLFFVGCATIKPDVLSSIWDEQIQCFSDYLGQDISPLVREPDYKFVDFDICTDLSGTINGCAFVFEATLGHKFKVGELNGVPVEYVVGEDVTLFQRGNKHFVAVVLIEKGKAYPNLPYHEDTHIILGELFSNVETQTRGIGDLDSNHSSLFFAGNSPCRH